jgi:two-component system response regulator YesN
MREITMCIIDDVKTVVDGITTRIRWSDYGISIAGTAANGKEGLALIKEKKPDIVLTDIRMPMSSGIDMVRELKNNSEHAAKVIFFSGYSDFAYAQESVRLGAFDYLLKPFTTEQIVDTVLRAKARIETEDVERLNRLELERKLRESLPFLRQEYFRLLIRHEELPERASDKWDFLGIDMETKAFVALSVQIEELMNDKSQLPVREIELGRFAVQNILEETVRKQAKGIVFREHLGNFVIVLNPEDGLDVLALAEACRDNVKQFAKREISIGVGGRATGIGEIVLSYQQAKTALSYQFYSGSGCIIAYQDIERQGRLSAGYSADKETELLYCLRSGNREGTKRLLDAIFEECLRYPAPPDPETTVNLFYGLAFSMFRIIVEKADQQQRGWLDEQLATIKNGRHVTTAALQAAVEELALTGCDWLQKRQRNDVGQLIQQALTYMRSNLGKELTIQECAGVVHLSPSYFSNQFKKETGMTFMQYVTSARMDKAKKLLLEGMQVQDITFELGYRDRPYFSELFKKHTGLTPTEFRSKYETAGNPVAEVE